MMLLFLLENALVPEIVFCVMQVDEGVDIVRCAMWDLTWKSAVQIF